MKIEKLYNELVLAFSNENLNQITRELILLYKNKNFRKIREIANKISKYIHIDEEKDEKCFSKLLMLYHPDKGEFIRMSMQKLYDQNDYENLYRYSHIHLISDIDLSIVTAIDEDIDYNPDYVWDVDINNGFSFSDSRPCNDSKAPYEYEKSFYNLIKIIEYGTIDIEFPTYYLEDFEEFEMAYSGLESLDGVEYCIHVKILDISNNELSDISNLWSLSKLEELFLSDNQIGYIDTLSNLINLKVLDLSGNQIDDISPLFNLHYLEYVNLMGNPIRSNQIEKLRDKGIIVMTDTV